MKPTLDIPAYFDIVTKNLSKNSWATPKAISEGLSKILYLNVKGVVHDTFFNKFFNGTNKGKNLYLTIREQLETESFTEYICRMERSFQSINYKDKMFGKEAVSNAIYEQIKTATNISGSVHDGLVNSYMANKEDRLYLFLSESLYYCLASQNDSNVEYIALAEEKPQLNAHNNKAPWTKFIDEGKVINGDYSVRFMNTLNMLSEEEIQTFMRLAKLVITDEDEEPYLYAPVTDEEIELYKEFGIGNKEFLSMEACGMINMGARIKNIIEVTDDAYYGFQNDNLVLAMTAQESQSCEVEYRSYSFTPVGIQLLEVVQEANNNDFFRGLVKIVKNNMLELPIDINLMSIENPDNMNTT